MTYRVPSLKYFATLALEGQDMRPWYDWARVEIEMGAPLLGCTPVRLADLLALFSPRVSVKRSVTFAVVYQASRGEFAPDVTRSVRAAVEHYEKTREIRGVKTAPFAKALLGDKSAIVLDSWMGVAFKLPNPKWIGDKRPVREAMNRALIRLSKHLDWPVAEAQAAVWAGTIRRSGPYATARTIGVLEEIKNLGMGESPF